MTYYILQRTRIRNGQDQIVFGQTYNSVAAQVRTVTDFDKATKFDNVYEARYSARVSPVPYGDVGWMVREVNVA